MGSGARTAPRSAPATRSCGVASGATSTIQSLIGTSHPPSPTRMVESSIQPITVVGHPPQVELDHDKLDYLLIEVNFVVRGLSVYIQALRNEDQRR